MTVVESSIAWLYIDCLWSSHHSLTVLHSFQTPPEDEVVTKLFSSEQKRLSQRCPRRTRLAILANLENLLPGHQFRGVE